MCPERAYYTSYILHRQEGHSKIEVLGDSTAGNTEFSQKMTSCEWINFKTILFPLVPSHYGKFQNFNIAHGLITAKQWCLEHTDSGHHDLKLLK
jgi:hypothetical protein